MGGTRHNSRVCKSQNYKDEEEYCADKKVQISENKGCAFDVPSQHVNTVEYV